MKLGLSYHEIEKGIIITNHTFTKDAIDLAEKNNIVLWDQAKLVEKGLFVNRYFKHPNRTEPIDEIKFDDLSSTPFEKISIETIDLMSHNEFQYYLAELFKRKGYKLISVHQSREKGIDLITEKNSMKIGIQVKKDIDLVGREAIKELITGIPYYQLQVGYAITNHYYNDEAKMLADVFKITLWDRDQLIKEMH